jgi:hypothetical protein
MSNGTLSSISEWWNAPAGVGPGGTPTRKTVRLERIVPSGKSGGQSLGRADSSAILPSAKDWRVRITLPPNAKFAWKQNGGGLMGFLKELVPQESQNGADFVGPQLPFDKGFDGVVFPYTPTMTVTHNARYGETALTHSNYKNYFYEGSDVAAINIAGVFTCQNPDEARYVISCLQFLRGCTKMHYGLTDRMAGTPPQIVRLSGYGDHYLAGSLSCVVTQVSHTMPDSVDYIKYGLGGAGNSEGWFPTESTMTVTLQPIYSRARQASDIPLEKFLQGDLIAKNDSKAGGMI